MCPTAQHQVALTSPGSTEALSILRNGERKSLNVTIGNLAKDKLLAQGPAQRSEEVGLAVQTLRPELAEQFDAKSGEGVVAAEVRPGSMAATVAIEPGSVILQVDGKSLGTAAAFARAVKEGSRRSACCSSFARTRGKVRGTQLVSIQAVVEVGTFCVFSTRMQRVLKSKRLITNRKEESK